ncbi:MAG: beta-N-acetylhexosaminidase [endosymbiont of Galathealinum brachiosum]|uniref:Beta-hexosaminidase n=1 Tax=endosymbiont of Galathealinum brachiosum TaxID=2200906 RepID=A0A370DI73_9GAMM|nr:MAG: beta-N-acetylhexosaminidase [endosymbiont of Galathealinum brachiosum]
MSLGPVMLDLVGTFITPEEREMMLHPQTGGVILFTRNYETPEQIAALVQEIHALRTPHLLVAVDHEGGRVQRFREGFTHIPPAAVYGKQYADDKKQAKQLARDCGWLMAAECRAVGIDMSFAPVLDIGIGLSGVIGDRAYHSRPEIIAELAHEYMQGMHKAGMEATGKHFPGHGSVKEDSHTAHPVDKRSLNDIMMEDVIPFERMINYGLAAVMPAHVVYPAIDDKPAGYSHIWLQEILRQRLNFQGVIFSDDLSMEAAGVVGDFAARADRALNAGCDMVLVCNHSEAAQQVLESLENYSNPASQMRLIRMHGRGDISRKELMASTQWKTVVEKIKQLGDGPNLELDV